MISKSATWDWIQGMVMAGYTDEEIKQLIISQAVNAIKKITAQEVQDMEVLATFIKDRKIS